MEKNKDILFVLTREDILALVREANAPEDIVDDIFIEDIKIGVRDLVKMEIKRFLREITG